MGEQGSTVRGRVYLNTRRMVMAGGFSAMSLGDLQGGKRKLAARLCQRHVWRVRKWFRECTRCGLVEDR